MNPLSRFVALALFVILAALATLLALAAWREGRVEAAAAAVPQQFVVLSQRAALILAISALALSLVLLLGPAMKASRPPDATAPLDDARREVSTLARLAETSVAQGAELSRERDVRRRAEEDARLKQHLLEQSLDERIRLGRDLHDGIIQSLYATGLTIESVRAIVRNSPEEAGRQLDKVRESLNGTIRDVRDHIAGLAPERLRQAGFARGLGALLGDASGAKRAKFEVRIDEDAASRLSAEQGLEALQIAREAVSNALRHGGATQVTVRMHQNDDEVCLLVQDNGCGFDPSHIRESGYGLGNMRARAGKMGATLRLTSHPGEGTRLVVTLPLKPISTT